MSIIFMRVFMYFYLFFTFIPKFLLFLCIFCDKIGRTLQGGSFMDSISNSYLTVDLYRIKQNAAAIHQDFPQQQLIPVLKADTYGLGMKAVANALSALPSVSCFAVAQAKEGILLKQEGIRKDILVLNEVLPRQIDAAVQYDLTLTVGNIPHLLDLKSVV